MFLAGIIEFLFIFGRAGASLLHELFASCGEQGLLSSCAGQASHCRGSSCCRTWALGVRASGVVACELQSAGLTVVVPRRSCPTACGTFLDQGSNPCLLHCTCVLYTESPGNPLVVVILILNMHGSFINFKSKHIFSMPW